MTRRRICVVTTSRADYGHLRWLMLEIQGDADLELQVIATGMHLMAELGMTVGAIEADGISIDRRIDMRLTSDNQSDIVKSIGVECHALADALRELEPEFVVVLGDRFEIVPVALAAVVFGVPVAHIHGGETSQGSVDEFFRHAVTKLSSVHFPATEIYRNRILQMGEGPDFAFNFGAPGLDGVYKLPLLDRAGLEEALKFPLAGRVAMVTYHAVTTEPGTAAEHARELLTAVRESGLRAVFTRANADPGGAAINRLVADCCRADPGRFRLFDNLGQVNYLSCLRNLDLMIGNSSSGLIEAPSFGLPVVNVGDRQKGRTRAANVIDVGNASGRIRAGIDKALSPGFRESLAGLENPYDRFRDGMTSRRIKDALKGLPPRASLRRKAFRDLV